MEIDTKCPHCGTVLEIDDRWLGNKIECPSCSKTFVFSNAASESVNTSTPRLSKNDPKQYKVLTQKDKWFSGKFDPEKLEGAINAYAKQGWRFVGCATASMPGLLNGTREEMVIIMERG